MTNKHNTKKSNILESIRNEIRFLLKEELEVILTDEEAIEFFNIDPSSLVEILVKEDNE